MGQVIGVTCPPVGLSARMARCPVTDVTAKNHNTPRGRLIQPVEQRARRRRCVVWMGNEKVRSNCLHVGYHYPNQYWSKGRLLLSFMIKIRLQSNDGF